MLNWKLNGTFLISYVKKNKLFHSHKTCLSHGKTIVFFRLIYTCSATFTRPLPDRRANIARFSFSTVFIKYEKCLEKSTVY